MLVVSTTGAPLLAIDPYPLATSDGSAPGSRSAYEAVARYDALTRWDGTGGPESVRQASWPTEPSTVWEANEPKPARVVPASATLSAEPHWAEDERLVAEAYPAEPYLAESFAAESFAADASPCQLLRDSWHFQVLPDGLIYRSYLAGVREPRISATWMRERHWGWIWDVALGGRAGVFRYGTSDPLRPEGFQVDIEGAGLPRLDLEHDADVLAADFRFGVPLTYGRGAWQWKLAYYHLSSHLGDEFIVRFPEVDRINFSRDVLVFGSSYHASDDLRLYAEMGWAFQFDGGTRPWEFQFGADYSPARISGHRGSPFAAINGHLHEELDFSGSMTIQAGWQWRGVSGHLFRMGLQYFAGRSEQYQFFDQYEEKIGLGLWYDY